MSMLRLIGAALLATGFLLGPAGAAENPARGKQVAEFWCSNCHRIAPEQRTVLREGAPDFVVIARGRDRAFLWDFFGKLHPVTTTFAMPTINLTDQEAQDVIGYIMSLAPGR